MVWRDVVRRLLNSLFCYWKCVNVFLEYVERDRLDRIELDFGQNGCEFEGMSEKILYESCASVDHLLGLCVSRVHFVLDVKHS